MTPAWEQPTPLVRAIQQALQRGNLGNQMVSGWGDDLTRRVCVAIAKTTGVDPREPAKSPR